MSRLNLKMCISLMRTGRYSTALMWHCLIGLPQQSSGLTESLETAEGRIEDYRFYSLELLYLLTAGHLKPVKKAYVTSGQRRIADEAEKCICRDLQTVYTVEQLALRAGVSPSSLKKYFAMVYGCPISEYIRRKRMEYACALLKDTDQSITDINSESAGYQLNFFVGGQFFL